VLVSGGPKLPSIHDLFQMTYDAVQAGAAGVVYGRNVWQADNPAELIRALAAILHEGARVEDALGMVDQKGMT
jgi:DhnA family fructose-bisphosphate aldolase class Ia